RGKSRELMSRAGGAEETCGGQGAPRVEDTPADSSAPPGRPPNRRRLPRVALAALAPPVATILRLSGADGVRAASFDRLQMGNLSSCARERTGGSIPDTFRPGGAPDGCHGWSGAEGAAQPVESRAN